MIEAMEEDGGLEGMQRGMQGKETRRLACPGKASKNNHAVRHERCMQSMHLSDEQGVGDKTESDARIAYHVMWQG